MSLFKGHFSEAEYRAKKRQYFVEKLKNEVGNPRDTEIVQELFDYLIEIRYIQNEQDLERLLTHPFLKSKLFRSEEYRERLRERPIADADFDPSKIRSAEYAQAFREKLKLQVIEEEKDAILHGVEADSRRMHKATEGNSRDKIPHGNARPNHLPIMAAYSSTLPFFTRLSVCSTSFIQNLRGLNDQGKTFARVNLKTT